MRPPPPQHPERVGAAPSARSRGQSPVTSPGLLGVAPSAGCVAMPMVQSPLLSPVGTASGRFFPSPEPCQRKGVGRPEAPLRERGEKLGRTWAGHSVPPQRGMYGPQDWRMTSGYLVPAQPREGEHRHSQGRGRSRGGATGDGSGMLLPPQVLQQTRAIEHEKRLLQKTREARRLEACRLPEEVLLRNLHKFIKETKAWTSEARTWAEEEKAKSEDQQLEEVVPTPPRQRCGPEEHPSPQGPLATVLRRLPATLRQPRFPETPDLQRAAGLQSEQPAEPVEAPEPGPEAASGPQAERQEVRPAAPPELPEPGPGTPPQRPEAPQEVPPAGPCCAPELGDVIVLGPRSPPEFRGCPAVVTKVADSHCTVVVLDETRCFGIGECWPNFDDLEVESRAWRLGTRVVIDGLMGGRTRHLNGLVGTLVAHPREGHPSFLRKQARLDRPVVALSVRLENPVNPREKSVLLEPRYLAPHDSFLAKVADDLGAMLGQLGGGEPKDAAA